MDSFHSPLPKESGITKAMINAAAAVLDPRAMSDAPYTLGCDGPWHYEAHSFHSACRCGSKDAMGKKYLLRKQLKDRERVRERAARVLEAALEDCPE